ncbi:MAG: hypothetical protein JSU63_00790 [Phycisphaerales bacterium]|nr:MAG: hypothetical protein JSU63_00790 [Phycisphaerales bacterium]
MMVERSNLIKRLSAIRTTVRRRLVAYGMCAVGSILVASLLVIFAFDWLLRLPAALRVLVAVVFLIVFVGATLRWIVKPLQAEFRLDSIAARLERHFVHLQDRLTSTVDFLQQGAAQAEAFGSASMMKQVVANTDQLVKDVPLESALSFRPLATRGMLLAVSIALLAGVLFSQPGWLQTGFYRYVYPFGEIEWPRNVQILPLTAMQTVALGESVSVRMEIGRGLHDDLRGIVYLRSRNGSVASLAMQRDRDGSFYAAIDTVTEDLDYWFEAGDATTERNPFTIRVVRRPAVVEALATVEPPPYASSHPVVTQDLADSSVEAVIGGYVTVGVLASKAIPSDQAELPVGLRLEPTDGRAGPGALIPLLVDSQNPRRLRSRFEVVGDMDFRVELRDEEGFENRRATRHSINAIPDAPPKVAIVEPKSVIEMTPQGTLRLVVQVEDDFGISALDLRSERPADGQVYSQSLTDRIAAAEEGGKVKGMVEYEWSVEDIDLAPGDVIVYRASATDNYPGAEGAGQVGHSPAMRVRIISDAEFDARVRDELALLEERMRRMVLDESETHDATSALLQAGEDPTALTQEEIGAVSDISIRQSRMGKRMRYLSKRFIELGRRVRQNVIESEDDSERVHRIGEALRDLAAGPLADAAVALEAVADDENAARQQTLLTRSASQQQTTIDRLNTLIRDMSRWGDFQAIVSKTRDILDRQEALRTQTVELGKSMLGKEVDSLTAGQTALLKRTHRSQRLVATDAEELLAQMTRLVTSTRNTDPSGVEAIEAALRAARARNVTGRLRSAADAVESNRTAAAVIDQRVASAALRQMLSALSERDQRELLRLRKRIQDAQNQVKMLIEQQRDILSATQEAGLISQSPFESLEQEQRRLRRNTGSVAGELAGSEQTAPAARSVGLAEDSMAKAEVHLQKEEAERAALAQEGAIESLEDALAILEELARKADEQQLQRSLMQILEGLAAIRAVQGQVNDGIAKLDKLVDKRGRLRRSEAREAARLARQQTDARTLLGEVLPNLLKVPVYEWALRRVAGWMDACRSMLDRRQINDELVSTAQRIVSELDKLISAILETQALPMDSEFAEAAARGGGAEARWPSLRPVPTIAELFVLKAMQVDVNQRTTELHESMDLENATENQLRALKMVGEDQAQVRRLTDMVTKRARTP